MNGTELLADELCTDFECGFASINTTTPDDEPPYSVTTEKLDRLKEALNGQVLNITFMEDYPLSYTKENSSLGYGVAFELLEFLTEKFNFTYNLVRPEKNILGSTQQFNGSILEVLERQLATVAVSFLPVMTDAQKHIFYSATTLDEGEWVMIMTRPEESASGSGLLAPFDVKVWVLILVSLLFVGPIIYLIILMRYKMTKDREQKLYTMPHCVWFVYGALMRQGSVLSPTGDSTRLLFATWWIFITILTSFYTANLTAFLTLSQFTLPINNVDDILRKEKRFVAHSGSGVEYAITNHNESLMQLNKMVEKNLGTFSNELNDTAILWSMVEAQSYVFVRDKPAVQHLIYQDYKFRKRLGDDEKIHCAFAVAKEAFLKRRRTFAYSKGFRYQQLFDYELLYLVEAGIVKYKLNENLPEPEICPNNLPSIDRQLRNGDLMMTYYVMIAGFCTSIAVFISEMFFKVVNHKKQQQVQVLDKSYGRVVKAKKINVSPPPPYSTTNTSTNNPFNHSRFMTGSDLFYGQNFSGNSPVTHGQGTGMPNSSRKMINGRDYMVIREKGQSRLIPMRVPSAALFQYSYTN